MKRQNWYYLLFVAILILTAGLKTCLLIKNALPFNSDEAIVGLMAKHILEGERPTFFYGQAYMGSLDAWLVSAGFAIFGTKVWVIRLVQIILYMATVALTMYLVKKCTGSPIPALISGILMAFPPVNTTLYTTVSLGGYGETLLLGTLLMVILIRYRNERISDKEKLFLGFGIGAISGFGFWINGLSLVYSIPIFGFFLWDGLVKNKKIRVSRQSIIHLLVYLFGLCAGLLPWIIYVLHTGWQSVLGENLGSAISVNGGGYFITILEHIRNFLLFGISALLGLRPPWGVNFLAIPMIPVVLAVWVLIFLRGFKVKNSGNMDPLNKVALAVCIVLLLGFIFTPFGNDPSGRYFLPVYQMLVIFASITFFKGFHKPTMAVLGIVFIAGFHLMGTIQCAQKNPPGITTQFDTVTQINHTYDQELIKFLKNEGEMTGFSNYWVSYPLAFLSNEELIFVPELPYHEDLRYTSRDNRYQPYIEKVNQSNRIAYITTKHPQLNARIRDGFRNAGVTWQEKQIGDYQVFYHLSSLVYPDDLDLGLIK
ncbi:MAG: glycosyltransferase family 39 protein [Anaerolineaceae bacterium]